MRKRVIVTTLLLVTIISGSIFILISGQKSPREKIGRVNDRKYVPVNFRTGKAISFKDEIYRLLPYKDSAILLTDTLIYVVSNDLAFKKEVLVPFKKNQQAYYLYINGNFFAGLDFNSNSLYTPDASLNSDSKDEYFSNAVYCGGKMYVNKMDLKKDIYSIDCWNPQSAGSQSLLDFRQFLKQEISHCKECFSSTLEGNFFRISDSSFGYYFYRGGYFLAYSKGEFKLKKTIIDYPFIVFTEKSVTLPGGVTGYQCFPERDVSVQRSACSDGKFIFILSNVIKKGLKERAIDIYSADSLGYIKSYSVPDYKEGKPNDILFAGGRLLVVYDNNFLVSYTVEEK